MEILFLVFYPKIDCCISPNVGSIDQSTPEKVKEPLKNLGSQKKYLKTSKTWTTRYTGQSDIADIRWSRTGNRFVNDQSSIFEIRSSRQFHLPKFLQSFHYVDWKENQKWPAWVSKSPRELTNKVGRIIDLFYLRVTFKIESKTWMNHSKPIIRKMLIVCSKFWS